MTRIPAWFKNHCKKIYKCVRCLDSGRTGMGKVCKACDPTEPDKEELEL